MLGYALIRSCTGSSDKLLIYLTLYISACLRKLEGSPNPGVGQKVRNSTDVSLQRALTRCNRRCSRWQWSPLRSRVTRSGRWGGCTRRLRAARRAVRLHLLHCPRRSLLAHSRLADALRAYLKQAREELGLRLLPRCYTEDGQLNKFWMAFSRRQFMNKQLL